MREFRKVLRTLHRDFGFLAVGLTLVYAISGLAVNHAHHWDANYSRTRLVQTMEPVGIGPTAEVGPVVLERLGLNDPIRSPQIKNAQIKNTWRASEEVFQVFLEGAQFDVNLVTGEVVRQGFAKRPLVWDVNFMHLNSGKAPWTGIADVYAGILILLALTGPFLIKGSKGLSGRGGLLMALGILVPVAYGIVTRFTH